MDMKLSCECLRESNRHEIDVELNGHLSCKCLRVTRNSGNVGESECEIDAVLRESNGHEIELRMFERVE